MKKLLIPGGLLLGATVALSQYPMSSPFQQPGWIAAPGSSLVNYPTLRPDAQSGPVVGKPLSATESRSTTQTLADGTHVRDSSSSLFYRDAQGRMRSESPTQALIFDPVAGYTYQLDLRNRTYWKGTIRDAVVSIAAIGNRTSINSQSGSVFGGPGPATLRWQAAPGKNERHALITSIHSNAVTETLPSQVTSGIVIRGSRITETIPMGTFGNDRDIKIVSERWFSDDLQVLVKSSNSDPRFGVTTYELTNIVQNPPDPSLFQVPADFSAAQERGFGPSHGIVGTPVKK